MEDESVDRGADREGGQRQRESAPADGRPADQQSERGGDQHRQQQRERGRQGGQPGYGAPGERPGQQRAQPGVPGLAERDLPAVAGDHDQREQDQPQPRAGEQQPEVVLAQRQRTDQHHQGPGQPEGAAGDGVGPVLGGQRLRVSGARAGEPAGDQHGRDQGQHEQVGADRLQQGLGPAGEVNGRQLALPDAESQCGGDRQRQAAQTGGDGHRHGLHDQQRQPVGVEPEAGREQHAGEAGRERAEGPAHRGHPVGVQAGELGEPAVVDHGADRGAEGRPAVHGGDPGGDQQHGAELDDGVGGQPQSTGGDQQQGRPHHHRRVAERGQSPEQRRRADQQHEHPDPGDQGLGGAGAAALEPPEHRDVHQHAQSGGEHQHAAGDGQDPGPVPDHHGLPQRVGGDHGDRALGQVEHAGGAVADHQSDAGQRGGAAHGDPGEGEVEQQRRGHPLRPPAGRTAGTGAARVGRPRRG